ncbi:hypothetical protein [Gemmatimonas aurantiaca]|uniref:hypothetical protein n=1 Tax=Gemmatimonas aurantiaca TaxID=173480 RepID=UPI00301CCC12
MTSAATGWLEIAKALIAAAAALVGMYVALRGLHTWRAQLHGKTEYDLARRLLRTTYRVRNEIVQVRRSWVSVAEMRQAYSENEEEFSESKIVENTAKTDYYVYQKRWKLLESSIVDFQVEVLEAEVLWGAPVKQAERALLEAIKRLNNATTDYLEYRSRRQSSEKMENEMDTIRKLVFSRSGDEFSREVEGAVAQFEVLLRRHLRSGA